MCSRCRDNGFYRRAGRLIRCPCTEIEAEIAFYIIPDKGLAPEIFKSEIAAAIANYFVLIHQHTQNGENGGP